MKIRFDFVTNSSSSSFVIFNVQNKELAKVCERFNIPVKSDGNSISDLLQAEQSTLAAMTPNAQSISEWFIKILSAGDDVYRFYYKDFSDAIAYIREHAEEIDEKTISSEIASASVVTDDEGSFIDVETRGKGTIESFSVDSFDWNYEERGVALWEILQGMDTRMIAKLRGAARENQLIRSQSDPWYREATDEEIYDAVDTPMSLEGKTCCLTGDFAFGSKESVEQYINERGGIISERVNRATAILVVGSLGSSEWNHKNYGTKVETAMEYREQGTGIAIVRERDLLSDIDGIEDIIEKVREEKIREEENRRKEEEEKAYYKEAKSYTTPRIRRLYEEWMKEHGHLISKVDALDFRDKRVVVSGWHPVYQKLIDLGVIESNKRTYFSGKSDYLFIEPTTCDITKLNRAEELYEKGKLKAEVILATDLFDLIEGGKFTPPEKKEQEEGSLETQATDKKEKTTIKLLPEDGKLRFIKRVDVPNTNWTIGVPEGFDYSDDPKKNGRSEANPNGEYDLIIAKQAVNRETDFINPGRNPISFFTMQTLSQNKLVSLMRFFSEQPVFNRLEWTNVIKTDDLNVKYAEAVFFSNSVLVEVLVVQNDYARRCQIQIKPPVNDSCQNRKKFVEQFLGSISLKSDIDPESAVITEPVDE